MIRYTENNKQNTKMEKKIQSTTNTTTLILTFSIRRNQKNYVKLEYEQQQNNMSETLLTLYFVDGWIG